LTEKVGLADRVTYRIASATALPFRRREFGHVWMLDASIHVRDKTTLFREVARVLAPGGLLVLHDMPGPLPSAMRAVTSRAPYYAPPLSQLIRHVERAGLRPLAWRDTAPLVRADFEAKSVAVAKASAATPQQAPPEARRRLAQGRAALRGYLAALDTKGPGCGFLIATR
jgi:ubiquinone/menaquinone biosynthesis C-methylase UbiE